MMICCAVTGTNAAIAQIKLPAIIRDSVILQRDSKVNIWGWASPGEKISILFDKKKFSTKADKNGNWRTNLPATKAGGPYTIKLSGKNKIVLHEVLFGDVWFCSGQSNMVHQMSLHSIRYAKEIAEANNADIRQFWVPTATNLQAPQHDTKTSYWKAAMGDDIKAFSAVAYFFAKKIYEKFQVPIGIINASVGGTPIEAWTSEEGLKEFTEIAQTIQANKDSSYTNGLINKNFNQNKQTGDVGLTGEKKWFDANYQPKGWRNINIPGYWEDQGVKELDGIIWYRKTISIPGSMSGKPATVFLGRIVDADECYINGVKIGATSYLYPQRRYSIAQNILKAGENNIVIRVTNNNGKGGFVPDKPYCLFAGGDTIDLKGTWQYKVGAVFLPERQAAGSGLNFSEQNQPTALYNAMAAPVVNFTIKGFCWYQGESNAANPEVYVKLLPALISDWRNKWNQNELPFLFVQLPGFMDYNYLPSESNWALLRDAQLKTLSIPNTTMAVAVDLGEWNDIHPDNKKEVGERLALAALNKAYQQNIVYSGPIYQSSAIEGNKIVLHFSNIGSGLVSNDDEPLGDFAIAGADKKFVWANAMIEGDKVIAWSDQISQPLYVRYAWADNPPHANLYNKEGLPASPFRTDKP